MTYTTGELAELCGVTVRTVQYYDTKGLLSPSSFSEGGRRLYSDEDEKTLRLICYLRDLDFSLKNIATLLNEENSEEVIALLIAEQEKELKADIEEKQNKLFRLESLQSALKHTEHASLKFIGSTANAMKKNNKLKKLYGTLLLTGIPVSLLLWAAVILFFTLDIWWPFVVYGAIALPYAILISRYYFKHVNYVCPSCGEVFHPQLKEAFWANHTPKTRKLTCPHCRKKSFCLEVYRDKEKTNG